MTTNHAPRAAEERAKVIAMLHASATMLERGSAPFAAAVWRECAAAINARPCPSLLPARVEHVATTIGHEADRLASVLSDDSRMVCSLRALRDELREVERMLRAQS